MDGPKLELALLSRLRGLRCTHLCKNMAVSPDAMQR